MKDDNADARAAEANARAVIERVLGVARALGAGATEASLSTGAGLSTTVRLGDIEMLEHHRDKRMGVTVYLDGRKGSASSSDFGEAALRATVEAALGIARHTEPDACAGLADAEDLCREVPDLDLYHPWALPPEQAIDIATRCEAVARGADARITNSEGATVDVYAGTYAYGNTAGFLGAYSSSRSSIACTVIASAGEAMQRDYWYTVARDAALLEDPEAVGRRAAERALARLGGRKLETCSAPVVFEARAATTLFGHFLGAVSGGNLYRKASFLLDALGQPVFAPHVELLERPHLRGALGSAPFDGDGVATRERTLVEAGVLQGYVLSAYSARRLGMKTTGNAGGVHNLLVSHGERDLPGLLARMGRGLLVTELMGFGVNAVTGDYSRGASGFWVEDGAIAFPVEEITIAGNLKDMFRDIVEVGADVELRGNVRSGSVLIGEMTIAGA